MMVCIIAIFRMRRIRQQRMNQMVQRNFTPQIVTTTNAVTTTPTMVTGGEYGATTTATAYPVATAVPQAVAQPYVSEKVPIAVATAVPQL